jgi:hypothetical protein
MSHIEDLQLAEADESEEDWDEEPELEDGMEEEQEYIEPDFDGE